MTPEPINSTYWPTDETYTRICTQSGLGLFKCPDDMYCGNPSDYGLDIYDDGILFNDRANFGVTNFDNVGNSLLTVLVIIFNDDWTKIILNIMDADISYLAGFYGMLIIVIGSFFLMNLILAVII